MPLNRHAFNFKPKHREAYPKAFVNNKTTTNNASGEPSTCSHSLVALTPGTLDASPWNARGLEGRAQKPVCAASPGRRRHCAALRFQLESVRLNSRSVTRQSPDRYIFFKFQELRLRGQTVHWPTESDDGSGGDDNHLDDSCLKWAHIKGRVTFLWT